jgi:hypothetical protein
MEAVPSFTPWDMHGVYDITIDGPGVRVRLAQRFEQLRRVGAHSDLRDIHVFICHHLPAEILFAAPLAGRLELCRRAERRRL